MNPLSRLSRGLERRSAPSEVWPKGLSFSTFPILRQSTSSGQVVTPTSALATVPVFAAVQMLAGAVGSLPLKVYRGTDPREEATGSRQWRILHDEPNDEMAADEFWEIVMSSLLLWGNAFVWKERDGNGLVANLWPLDPARVRVSRVSDQTGESVRAFWVDQKGPSFETDILHIRGLSNDGLVGYSPIQQARNRLGVEMAREEFSGAFWKNGTFAGAVLTHPNKLSDGAIERLKTQMREKSGTLRGGEALILEEDMKWQTLGMPLEDAQFVQQANLGRLEVALLYGLPPHKLGAAYETRSMTYSNAEFEGLDFVKWSLRRWLVRIEKSLSRDPAIFPAPGPTLWCEFLVDAFLRGDTKTRYEAYQIGINAGFLTPEWVQETENLDIPDMTPADDLMPGQQGMLQLGRPTNVANGNGQVALPAGSNGAS